MSPARIGLKNPGFLISLTILLGVVLLYFLKFELLEVIELKILDTHFRVRGAIPPGGEVVIAAIDEKSIEELGRWPWPRSKISELIDLLSEAKAKVVTFDMIFSEPDAYSQFPAIRALKEEFVRLGLDAIPHRGEAFSRFLEASEQEADNDGRLRQSITKAGNVVLPLFFNFNPEQVVRSRPEVDRIVSRHAINVFTNYADRHLFAFPRALGVTACIPPLAEAACKIGHFNMMSDRDGVVRWELSAIEYKEDYLPSMALQAAAVYLGVGKQEMKIHFGEGLSVGSTQIPTDGHGRMLINYLGPTGTFRHYSVADILEGRVPRSAFQDKIVLIGATAVGIYDLRVTPFSIHFPGVEKHANSIDNILHQRFLKSPAWMGLFDLVAILLLGGLLSWILPKLRPLHGFSLAFFSLVGLLTLSHYLFTSWNIWLRILYPSLAIAFCSLGVESYKFLIEEREKKRIRGAFQHYVPPSVVNEILSQPGKLKFGGEKRELTVLFSDVRGFTTYSEKYPPEQVVEILNEYLTAMVDVVFKHEGTLDKFVGDEIMALFGAPIHYPDHAEKACLTALEMAAELERLRAQWRKEGREGFEIGIGINTGDMVVGNLGSSQLFDYTVIGDNVNLGARLEAINKNFETQYHIIISDSTYQQVKEKALVKSLDSVMVKGKTKPVLIYELLGMNTGDDSLPRISGDPSGEGCGKREKL
jgi:adenylate cyclase